MRTHSWVFFPVIIIALGSILFSLSKGTAAISLFDVISDLQYHNHTLLLTIFFQLRLLRTLTAFITGGLLALAGTLMQVLLENPLADPYALGISGGAALFTLLMMLLGLSDYWLLGSAWTGSLFALILVFLLAKQHKWQSHALLLTGIALACGFSAGISFILLMSPASTLHGMLFWLSGDLNDAQNPWLGFFILTIGLIACYLLAPGLNILSRGEKEARALGLPTTQYRLILYLLSSLFTASAVTLSGCIGFIGLLTPHLTRRLVGHDHRLVLPLSMLLGGSLLTVADTLARSLFSTQQLPVGILMAFLGVPVFILLLQKT